MNRTQAALASLGALAALALAAGQAEAHAHLVKASPQADASVVAPKTIQLQFSEKLEPKFSGFDLMKADGSPVPVKARVDAKTIDGAPAAPLAPGAYMVMWHVVSADGHKMKGDYNFTVR